MDTKMGIDVVMFDGRLSCEPIDPTKHTMRTISNAGHCRVAISLQNWKPKGIIRTTDWTELPVC